MNLIMDGWRKLINFNFLKKSTPKVEIFPCEECLLKPMCTQACDKLIMDSDLLMKKFLDYSACPDCGSKEFIEGPSGGMSQNIKCVHCRHWFNLALPIFVQRIRIDKEGRFRE